MSLSFQMLMKKAAVQTQSSQKEAAHLIAQRDAAQKKARQEQEAREAKEREARKAQLLHEMEVKRKAEEEALRKEQREKERQLEGDRRRERGWTPPALKARAGSSAQNRSVRQVQEMSDKSRSSSPRPGTQPFDRSTLSREEKRALANPLLREGATGSKPKVASGSKPAKRPGGPYANHNIPPSKTSKPYASARDRIAAEHFSSNLIVLNTVKKDTRTIDEIQRDLDRRRYGQERVQLVGPDATSFTDWFGGSKKEREKEAMEERERQVERERAEKQKLQEEEARARALATAKKAAAAPKPVPAPVPSSSARPGYSAASSSKFTASRPATRPGLAFTMKTPPALTPSKAHIAHALSVNRAGSSSNKRPHPYNAESEFDRRKYARLQSQAQQRHRAPDPDDYDSGLVDGDEEEEEESEGGAGSAFHYVPGTIAALLGRDIQRDAQRELSSSGPESEDEAAGKRKRKPKSYGYEELMREERRSAMLAKKEDEEEEARLKRHEQIKRRKKEARMKQILAKSPDHADEDD